MTMSGGSLSSTVQANLAAADLSNPSTAHSTAWDEVAGGIIDEMLNATHTLSVPNFKSGGTTLMDVVLSSITAGGLKSSVTAAIGGVSTGPGGAHADYWNAAGGGIINYLKANLITALTVNTADAVGHAATPIWKPGVPAAKLALASSIKAAVLAADKSNSSTVHSNMWDAVAGAIVSFINTNYATSISPGAASGGTFTVGDVE